MIDKQKIHLSKTNDNQLPTADRYYRENISADRPLNTLRMENKDVNLVFQLLNEFTKAAN